MCGPLDLFLNEPILSEEYCAVMIGVHDPYQFLILVYHIMVSNKQVQEIKKLSNV